MVWEREIKENLHDFFTRCKEQKITEEQQLALLRSFANDTWPSWNHLLEVIDAA